MIPILYTADENKFTTNGIGRLADCTRCIATEERNGIYELEFDYPITGEHYDEITLGRIVAATHDDRRDMQPFVIYQRTIPDLRGVVTFNAHHISYKLADVVVMPYTAGSCAAALEGLVTHAVNANPFTFWTDKTTVANFKSDEPRNARNMLGGEENSILDVFGSGEYEFDRFTVKLYAHRGNDTDVEIRYGKNLVDLEQKINDAGSFNAIVPFWKDSEGNILMLPEEIIVYDGLEPQLAYLTDHNLIIIRTETDEPIEVAYKSVKAAPMDLSDDFEEMPTVAQLRAAAQARFEAGDYWLPDENIEVDFVQLWQTEEYKEYSALQRVRLCDTVSVFYPQGGVYAVKQKVVKTVYNVLLDRYDKIELGTLQSSLGQAIKAEVLHDVPTTSMMESAIQYATEMIRGGLGGYVVMTPGPNGYPQEILIMDTPDVDTAVNVWRFNQGGLGHSSNGYEGPFDDIALTADGKINASIITTGTLNANIIKAGVLSDVNGNTSLNLSTGVLTIKKGSIDLGNGNFTVNDSGVMNAQRGYVGGFEIIPRSNGPGYLGSEITVNGTRYVTYISVPENTNPNDNWSLAVHQNGYAVFLVKADGSIYSKPRVNGNVTGADFSVDRTRIDLDGSTGGVNVWSDFYVDGTKSRRTKTDNYAERLLYCYETPTPLFGDLGEAVLDEEGICYVDIDDIFSETIAKRVEYQVFLQKEGEGDCWIAEKGPRYFVIQGTPRLKVAWELKAKQKDYENIRLEAAERNLDEYETTIDDNLTIDNYIEEQEALLYG